MLTAEESSGRLYHYCNNNTFCSIVSSQSLWLSSLSLSNDSMEGQWLKKLFEAECISAKISARDIETILRNFDVLLDIVDGLGFCLSEAGDMLSQWRGYASNGEGVAIGFRQEYLAVGQAPTDDVSGFSLQRVKYDEIGDPDHVAAIVKSLKKASDNGLITIPGLLSAPVDEAGWEKWRNESLQASSSMIMLMSELFVVKNPAFREELEWRLVSLDMPAMKMAISFRANGNSIVPFRQYPLDLSREPISQVVLGPRNQSKERDVSRFLEMNGFVGVRIVRSSASYR